MEELKAMSENPGMLENLCNILKTKKSGEKNEVNSYLAYVFGATTKEPEGDFAPHFHFDLARVSHLDVDIDFEFYIIPFLGSVGLSGFTIMKNMYDKNINQNSN